MDTTDLLSVTWNLTEGEIGMCPFFIMPSIILKFVDLFKVKKFLESFKDREKSNELT